MRILGSVANFRPFSASCFMPHLMHRYLLSPTMDRNEQREYNTDILPVRVSALTNLSMASSRFLTSVISSITSRNVSERSLQQ